jgi:hypothetical protein
LGGVSKDYPSVFKSGDDRSDQDGELEPDKSNLTADPYLSYGWLNIIHNLSGEDRVKWDIIFKWKALYFLFHAQHFMDEQKHKAKMYKSIS